jgi:RNA polymerase sigma-70 factor (ECF subfamily)
MINYFARMLWNDREKATDLTQDLFTKIINKPELYRSGSKFSTWIYSIASNMCKNEYRHHEVKERHAVGIKDAYTARVSPSASDIDHLDFKTSLDNELSQLEHPQRSTFIMRYKQGLSIKEIADVMECSEGTVKSRLFYTAKKLAKKLSHFDPKNT